MDIQQLYEAQRIASNIDWADPQFSWDKAYVSSVFASVAYERLPEFELKKAKRAKVIPCDSYQAHLARWRAHGTHASFEDVEGDVNVTFFVRGSVVVAIAHVRHVIFISLRGTTRCFADFMADFDARKVKYSIRFGTRVKFHRGFFEAVADCYDEVVERVNSMNKDEVPVCITGHSLGGAMAAILNARLHELDWHPFVRQRRCLRDRPAACYTFGMPRYGSVRAKSELEQPMHVFNELDAIPTLPPTFLGFADVSGERCLNAIPEETQVARKGNFGIRSGKGLGTVLGISDHRMERYVERSGKMRGP